MDSLRDRRSPPVRPWTLTTGGYRHSIFLRNYVRCVRRPLVLKITCRLLLIVKIGVACEKSRSVVGGIGRKRTGEPRADHFEVNPTLSESRRSGTYRNLESVGCLTNREVIELACNKYRPSLRAQLMQHARQPVDELHSLDVCFRIGVLVNNV